MLFSPFQYECSPISFLSEEFSFCKALFDSPKCLKITQSLTIVSLWLMQCIKYLLFIRLKWWDLHTLFPNNKGKTSGLQIQWHKHKHKDAMLVPASHRSLLYTVIFSSYLSFEANFSLPCLQYKHNKIKTLFCNIGALVTYFCSWTQLLTFSTTISLSRWSRSPLLRASSSDMRSVWICN